jgi:5-methyltetrahydrofolate--homocysteine methyltransferase
MTDTLTQLAHRLYDGDAQAVAQLTHAALSEGLTPEDVLNRGLVLGMQRVGVDFRAGELFIPEVLIAARAMHAGMAVLRPQLASSGVPLAGKVVLGTVKDDLHDIGKNLVGMMLEGAGFEVIDLGIDTPPQRFVEAVRRERPALVAISALLTTTMQGIVDTIEALTQAGMRDKVQIMVGGAPVTQAFASQIGADGYASDAASAADLARSLIESRRVMPGRAV